MINYQSIWLSFPLSVAKCRNCRSVFTTGDNGHKKAGYVPGYGGGVCDYTALVLKVRTCPVVARSSSR